MTAVQLDLIITDAPDPDAPLFPIDALIEFALIDDGRLAELVGLDRTWVNRRRRRGKHLDVYEADRWAVAAGYLPHEVWPEWLTCAMEVAS